jgi:hypothetical protein
MSIAQIGSNYSGLWNSAPAPTQPVAPAPQSAWAIGLVDLTTPAPAPVTPVAPVAPLKPSAPPAPPKPDPNEVRVKNVFQRLLGHGPNARQLNKFSKISRQMSAKNKDAAEIRKAIAAEIKEGREYRTKNIDDEIRPIYKKLLKRKPTDKAIAPYERLAKRELKSGDTIRESLAAVRTKIKKSAAYKELHKPRPVTNRDKIYMAQPNGWTCGPTSLTMAMAAFKKRPVNSNTLNEMIRRTGANSSVGVPGNASLIANAAKSMGCKAEFHASAPPSAIRQSLKEGHGVVLNGSLGTGGHFIYVAGIAKDGRFIICDPARPTITRMTDSELNHFANTYSNPRGFAEIWAER